MKITKENGRRSVSVQFNSIYLFMRDDAVIGYSVYSVYRVYITYLDLKKKRRITIK